MKSLFFPKLLTRQLLNNRHNNRLQEMKEVKGSGRVSITLIDQLVKIKQAHLINGQRHVVSVDQRI